MTIDMSITRADAQDESMSGRDTLCHPQDVLNDPQLSTEGKRVRLSSCASDARTVPSAPALRMLDSGAIVQLDAILDALDAFDAQEKPKKNGMRPENMVTGRAQTIARYRRRPLRWRRRLDDDDDPPPCPASAAVPFPKRGGGECAASPALEQELAAVA